MFDVLTTRRGFRLIWVLSYALMFLGLLAEMVFAPWLFSHPDVLKALQDQQAMALGNPRSLWDGLLQFVCLVLLICMLKSAWGVYRFKRADLKLSVWVYVLSALVTLFLGDDVSSGFGGFAAAISIAAYGLCLGAAFLSPLKAQFH